MIKNLVIGPGAMGFYMYLGTIAKLRDTGKLNDLEEISGASAGALIGLMYCMYKGDIKKILEVSLKIPIKKLMKLDIKTLVTKYGLISLCHVKNQISSMCTEELGKSDITFKELFNFFNVKLHISSYCVQIGKTKYFSVDSTPEMSVIEAVCASVAIPFLFSSIKLKDGMNYIDGGAIETAPGGPFIGKLDVLVIKISYDNCIVNVKDIKSYALSLLYANMQLRYTYSFPTFNIICEENIFDFGASVDNKIKMYTSGYMQEFSH